MMEGSGSVFVTNGSGCGSGKPKNIRILRIPIIFYLSRNVKNNAQHVLYTVKYRYVFYSTEIGRQRELRVSSAFPSY